MKFDGRTNGRVGAISWSESLAFRERHAKHPALVWDLWDEVSEHRGVFVRGALAATFRIVHVHDGRLPICEHLENAEIDGLDVQFGRFVAVPGLLRAAGPSALFVLFLQYFGIPVQGATHRVYAPLLRGGAFSSRRLLDLGFLDTGARYFDQRYAGEIIILVKPPLGHDDTLIYAGGTHTLAAANRPPIAQISAA